MCKRIAGVNVPSGTFMDMAETKGLTAKDKG